MPSQSPQKKNVFAPDLVRVALGQSVVKLDPRNMVRNPVMFVVEIGTVITALFTVVNLMNGQAFAYELAITLLLLFTVLFANFAEGLAEARGKAQAASLRSARSDTKARRLEGDREVLVSSLDLNKGDRIIVSAGEFIPGDGEIVEGVATIDESAITGESAPVVREAGTDHSGVTGGTKVLSDQIIIEITSNPGESFLDRMISLVEGASRQKTPNEIALSILLSALTLIFLVVVATLLPIAGFVQTSVSITTLVALLICLIPTTIGGLLPAIGIAGMDRALRANVIAKSGKAVEVAGDIDTLLLDKTGTITIGNRQATGFTSVRGIPAEKLYEAAHLASLSDPTPEGKSIVQLALSQGSHFPQTIMDGATFVGFTAKTRMSGVDLSDGRSIRKGASNRMRTWVEEQGGKIPVDLEALVDDVARKGGTPLVVAEGNTVLGVVSLSDIVKTGIQQRFAQLRKMGLRTVMITGDNPLTAAAIAKEAGVDDYLAEATPEDKLRMIREEQDKGKLVAMMGDGTNDAPALAQADVGLAMNSGTQAAKEAGNMVDLDSDPTKLLEVVEIGKQLLITRGSLTTFSIANDVAKYFAIIPAIFAGTLPALSVLNVMRLASPTSAILSAVIFNAFIIPILIPLALRGVKYTPKSADAMLANNLLVYGLGGLIVPFIGIKAIDLLLTAFGWI
ncbi:MAG: Potassium-transporting ATPase B chain [uncultured Truepera sp.]|uniref:Potassium-transporting ATPase ATP-binding subunit n=1 Tax=uncultured Truepera sp. TaxID=543023 RepID=A0A6J4VPZ0_9DEIN|nr:MAG: Potassium-transporting ATPase B chain [uncultured Truepera sp.]